MVKEPWYRRALKLARPYNSIGIPGPQNPQALPGYGTSAGYGSGGLEVPKTVNLIVHNQQTGSQGQRNFAGWTREEYLNNLQGHIRADVFDKMRRSDSQIKMALNSVKTPIKGCKWEVHPHDKMKDDPDGEADAELIKTILFESMDRTWGEVISEIVTFVEFGHSVFEMIDKPIDHPDLGLINALADISMRSQRTIYKWNLDSLTGKLVSISQYSFGDLMRVVDIPAQFLLTFALDQEGANYEGISALRPCYGNWFRKNEYLKLNAVGTERHAIPTPLVKIPSGKESGPQFDSLITSLEAFTAHDKNYITYPEGWEIDLHSGTYDPAKVEASIDAEDRRMIKSFLANFLELGVSTSTGSHALSSDLSEFFLGSIDHLAVMIEERINKVLIPRMVQLNRGPRKYYPQLKHSGILGKGGVEFAQSIDYLIKSSGITADDVLEEHLRNRYDLPPSDEATRRANPAARAGTEAANVSMAEKKKSLSERLKAFRRG